MPSGSSDELPLDGSTLLEHACHRGLEGIIAEHQTGATEVAAPVIG